MELLVIVLVLAYSIWSEISKKTQESDVDIDFSELSSLDDFFKDSGGSVASTPKKQTKAASSRGKKPRKKARPSSSINYDDQPALTGVVNYDRVETTKRGNYDELPQLTGVVNYDRGEYGNEAEADLHFSSQKDQQQSFGQRDRTAQRENAPQISFDRESIIKAFVMSEVLQRYDLERIYSRIPGINQQQEE